MPCRNAVSLSLIFVYFTISAYTKFVLWFIYQCIIFPWLNLNNAIGMVRTSTFERFLQCSVHMHFKKTHLWMWSFKGTISSSKMRNSKCNLPNLDAFPYANMLYAMPVLIISMVMSLLNAHAHFRYSHWICSECLDTTLNSTSNKYIYIRTH